MITFNSNYFYNKTFVNILGKSSKGVNKNNDFKEVSEEFFIDSCGYIENI